MNNLKDVIIVCGIFFILVVGANLFTGLFVPTVKLSDNIHSIKEVRETVVTLGLPEQMEEQVENWMRSQTIGTTLDIGKCSTATKLSEKEWQIKMEGC